MSLAWLPIKAYRRIKIGRGPRNRAGDAHRRQARTIGARHLDEPEDFCGDRKVGRTFLREPDRALVAWGLVKIPSWLETYHLTLATLLWSGLNVLFGYLARSYTHWLWMVSLMIVLQYLMDLFDGAVGRQRNTGLVKWKFYMDYLLDYVFLSSLVVAGYLIAPPGLGPYYLFLLALMISSFLTFAATNQFEIYFYGLAPTALRILFILINTVIILTGTIHFVWSVPVLCSVCLAALVVVVFRDHRLLWRLDMSVRKP